MPRWTSEYLEIFYIGISRYHSPMEEPITYDGVSVVTVISRVWRGYCNVCVNVRRDGDAVRVLLQAAKPAAEVTRRGRSAISPSRYPITSVGSVTVSWMRLVELPPLSVTRSRALRALLFAFRYFFSFLVRCYCGGWLSFARLNSFVNSISDSCIMLCLELWAHKA